MTRIIQSGIEFVNEKLQELLDSGCSFGLEGGTSVHFRSPVSAFPLSSFSLRPSVAAPAAALAAFPPQPEYEGGFNPHNQPVGFVARPKAAILSKSPPCKPVTIASRVRAIYARVRVSRWLAWITYLTQGEEIK